MEHVCPNCGGELMTAASEVVVRDEGVTGVRHLYVHLPFCAHRCGYCDFVTAVGRLDQHGAYVEALLAELELERERARAAAGDDLPRRRDADVHRAGCARRGCSPALPDADEVTVEANPETVTPSTRPASVTETVSTVCRWARRASSRDFWPCWSGARSRKTSAGPCTFSVMPEFDNISLDLIYGIPGQTAADLDSDLAEALALEPEHVSCYELEAKPGTRFTHAHGVELERQAESMESYFERVVATLTGAGYRWYETANFCRAEDGRDLRARHNLAYWLGRDYLGLGIGAVSTIEAVRRRNAPRLAPYLRALASGRQPPARARAARRRAPAAASG